MFDSKDNKEDAYGVQLLPSDRRVVEIEWLLHYSDEKEKNEESYYNKMVRPLELSCSSQDVCHFRSSYL